MAKTFDELINTRQSCRSYSGREVEKEKLEELVKAVRLTPSACNSQPWKLYVVTGERTREIKDALQLMGRNRFTEECPAFTVFVEKPATLKEGIAEKMGSQKFAQLDVGAAISYYTLKATDLGLQTCILGWFDEKKLTKALGLSKSEKVRLVVATGYAVDGYEIRENVRKDISDFVEFI